MRSPPGSLIILAEQPKVTSSQSTSRARARASSSGYRSPPPNKPSTPKQVGATWMTRTPPHRLSVSLVTLGDPGTLTGGYLYHRRLAELAPRHGARLMFASLPAWPFPFPVLYGPRLLRALSGQRGDVVVLDSIAAAFLAPWMAAVRAPVVVMAHQPPGGIDHGAVRQHVQAVLDRTAYRRVERVLVASELLAGQFGAQGFAGNVMVVP